MYFLYNKKTENELKWSSNEYCNDEQKKYVRLDRLRGSNIIISDLYINASAWTAEFQTRICIELGLFVIFAFIEMVENKWILALSLLPRSITLNFNRDKDAYLCWENHLSNMDGDQKRERISCSTSFEPEIRELSTKYIMCSTRISCFLRWTVHESLVCIKHLFV